MNEITEISYWDSGYYKKDFIIPSPPGNSSNYYEDLLILRIKEKCLPGKRVVEIGGGGSAVLARLALDHPETDFVCLDYAEGGCDLIRRFAIDRGISNLSAVKCDFRYPPIDIRSFDLVYSLGVVEHFSNLTDVLSQLIKYTSEGGEMITLIPNMSGFLGFLTKIMDRSVYEMHVPHNKYDFYDGHAAANLFIESCDYFGSSNFGVLSSCASRERRLNWIVYTSLSRISKIGFLIEKRFGNFPATQFLSPYILAVSRRC